MKKSKKLVFFGTESFSEPTLIKLISGGWEIEAVVTKPDSPTGRGLKIRPPRIKEIAKTAGIKVYQPQIVSEIEKHIKKIGPDAGILAAYGKILPQSLLDLFPFGIINIHPSLLPKYRGPSPVETAILNGDKYSGISLIRLTAGMDEGPVYVKRKIEIPQYTDEPLFSGYLAELGAELLVKNLSSILSAEITALPQDKSKASYTKMLKKSDGYISWNNSARNIERKVRAYLGWPRSRAIILGKEVVITKTRVAKSDSDGDLVIKCRPGWLEIQELIAPSGRKMTGADYIRGYRKQ